MPTLRPKNLTKRQTFERVVAICKLPNGGARGGIVIACDMLHQGALYDLQEKLIALLLDLAEDLDEGTCARLVKEFPFAFEPVSGVQENPNTLADERQRGGR